LITWDVSVDSTIARAHQHAAGARKQPQLQVEPPGGIDGAGGVEPDDHALGRSRGGWTTKLHLACEQGRKVLSVVVTGGQRGDSPQFATVLGRIRVPRGGVGRPRSRPDMVLADKAYSSRANRACGQRRGMAVRRGAWPGVIGCGPARLVPGGASFTSTMTVGGRWPVLEPVWLTAAVAHLFVKGCCW
jgi:hypothetical protein